HAVGVLGLDPQASVVSILDVEVLALDPSLPVGKADQAPIPADPVIHMHDELADLEIAQEAIASRYAESAAGPAHLGPAKDLAVGQHGQACLAIGPPLVEDPVGQDNSRRRPL